MGRWRFAKWYTPSGLRILVLTSEDYYKKARPNRYPIPKKTKITTATTNATSPIMSKKLG